MLKIKVITLFFLSMLLCATVSAQPPVLVDINNADVTTLVKHIKGIGVKKAEAIVKYRDEHGPFKSVEDMTMVSGVGQKIIEMNRDILTTNKK